MDAFQFGRVEQAGDPELNNPRVIGRNLGVVIGIVERLL
jgi:hypothetical protein